MNDQSNSNFFSVGFGLILLDKELPYDLYVNSSSNKLKEKFVRIFPMTGLLTKEDVENYKHKYHQLYIPEDQRDLYLRSLIDCAGLEDLQKAEVIKDSAIHYLTTIFDPTKEFSTEVLNETINGCRDSVESMVDVLKEYDVKQVQNLIGDLSFHDFYTYDHSINVSMYCISIYKILKPNAAREEIVLAGLGGLLHDLGKIKIPTHIINNAGKLDDEQFSMIKKHPRFGFDLITKSDIDCPGVDFEIVQRIVYEHHENYNGTGYPEGLKGEEIHLLARITSIADFFDAITTKRSYHEALTPEDALAVMSKSVGKKIDPALFEIFKKSVSQVVDKTINKELPDDFDPCQPHDVLPFRALSAKPQQTDFFKKEEQSYGKVAGSEDFGVKKKAS
ncbi:HD-GYP domain-containing protein [Halobacteriovorax sp. HLS]|uniref:HD-GYP domain-containing protein n=1 Tax=Halobacteriovorax sp. HLS TaxID=2234000 RepID=UPI000FDA6338|nr:HD domain-containing phosphohydrolase [Halobacteriovorax sp. HLS]